MPFKERRLGNLGSNIFCFSAVPNQSNSHLRCGTTLGELAARRANFARVR